MASLFSVTPPHPSPPPQPGALTPRQEAAKAFARSKSHAKRSGAGAGGPVQHSPADGLALVLGIVGEFEKQVGGCLAGWRGASLGGGVPRWVRGCVGALRVTSRVFARSSLRGCNLLDSPIAFLKGHHEWGSYV